MTKKENAVLWMINLAEDNSHGYSWGGWGPQDYDCGHAIITAFEQAGIPVKTMGATYTENMYSAMMRCGFSDVTRQCNLSTGEGMQRGDVLLNVIEHTAMYIGNGSVVHARSSEGNTQSGDQSGNEIRIQSYWNYPWNYVLRPPEEIEDEETDESDGTEDIVHPTEKRRNYFHLEYGDGLNNPLPRVKAWQNHLIEWGFVLDPDGEFGSITKSVTMMWQRLAIDKYGADLSITGAVNEDDWKEIIHIPEE